GRSGVRGAGPALAPTGLAGSFFMAQFFSLRLSVLFMRVAGGGAPGFWLTLLAALSLGAMGAGAVGLPAYVYGYFFAEFRTAGSTDLDRSGTGGGDSEVCSICGASRRRGGKKARVCSTCQP